MNNTIKRIGFACIYSELHPKKGVVSIPEYNLSGTTVAWLNRQTKDVAVEKLWTILKNNLQNAYNLINKVGSFDPTLRMVRIGSDVLPVYTHKDWSWFWKQPDVISYCEKHFAKIGDRARELNVRVSFHPGQFVVLSSIDPGIVVRSLEEFEYHADMARWMGFGEKFQDCKINVHISGRLGPDGIRQAYKKLSPEARNCITIENEEITHGLDDCLTIGDLVPIVLDINHHWVREGEYIRSSDPRIKKIIDSWRGVRPTIHYSLPREDYLVDHPRNILPNLPSLLREGFKKQKLRAHSDMMWNAAANTWAREHWEWSDVMVEAKSKNIASFNLHKAWSDTPGS